MKTPRIEKRVEETLSDLTSAFDKSLKQLSSDLKFERETADELIQSIKKAVERYELKRGAGF